MSRTPLLQGSLPLLGACFLATACGTQGFELKGDVGVGAEEVCGWKDMAWSHTFVSACSGLTLNPGQYGICYESGDPLVVDAELMAVRADDAAADLSICLSSDDVYVYIGTLGGKSLLTHGSFENASDYFPAFGFGRLNPVPDGTKTCFGATVAFGTGSTVQGGAGFVPSSYYWKRGNIKVRAAQPFGPYFGITAEGDELHIPTPGLKAHEQPVKLGLPGPILELENSAADHWPAPSDVQEGC